MVQNLPIFFEESLVTQKRRAVFDDPVGYRIVSVRLRCAEFESFSEQVRAFGLTNNLALRIAARRIAGFLEVDAETRRNLHAITNHIGQMAEALNDLSRLARDNGAVDMESLDTYRQEFGQEFVSLDALLRVILNVSRRRLDGRRLLENTTR